MRFDLEGGKKAEVDRAAIPEGSFDFAIDPGDNATLDLTSVEQNNLLSSCQLSTIRPLNCLSLQRNATDGRMQTRASSRLADRVMAERATRQDVGWPENENALNDDDSV